MKHVNKKEDNVWSFGDITVADVRAGNGGLYGGQRTVRNDKTIFFDGDMYFSHSLSYYQRHRVWVEYDGNNNKNKVNVYNNNDVYRRLICTIDNSKK